MRQARGFQLSVKTRRRTIRALSMACLLLGSATASTACGVPLVPVAPERVPLWMRIEEGVAEFLWCGEPTSPHDYMLVEYLVVSDSREEGVAAEGSGAFTLSKGDRFSTQAPPGELRYTRSALMPSTQDFARVFASVGEAPDEISWTAAFEPGILADASDGTWLSPTGVRESNPCPER